jgi:integrase
MPPAAKKHLPFSAWPTEDRALWSQIFEPDVFDDKATTGDLAAPTVVGLRTAYARYLGFLANHDPERLRHAPPDRIDLESIKAFVAHLRESCRDTSVASLLHTFRHALGYMFQQQDWSWLKTIAKQIEAGAVPRGDTARGVTSAELYAIGIELMTIAEEDVLSSVEVSLDNALLYRDGLIIALTALVTPRRRTLTALTTTRHLVRTGDHWLLDIPGTDTKTGEPLEFPLPDSLSERISLYLCRFRDVIPGAGSHEGLWPSTRGRPMAGGSIYDMVRRRTEDALGFPVNLHAFRLAAGNFWSIVDPANVRGVKDLLGHTSFGTTEKHYIGAQSRSAGRALANVLRPSKRT